MYKHRLISFIDRGWMNDEWMEQQKENIHKLKITVCEIAYLYDYEPRNVVYL